MSPYQPKSIALDDAVFAFQRMGVPPLPAVDEPLLDAGQRSRVKRILYLAGSAAAAALLLMLPGWLVMSTSTSNAMAEVIRAAASHDLVRMTQVQITDDHENGRGETKSTVYWDLTAPRCRTESQIGETLLVDVQDYAAGRWLMTDSKKRTASLFLVKPKEMAFLDNLIRLRERNETVQTEETLNGRAVMRFSLREGNNTTTLWVDRATNLPVRMEFEMAAPDPKIAMNKWTWQDFAWDPPLPVFEALENLFDTTPPSGYDVETKDRTAD